MLVVLLFPVRGGGVRELLTEPMLKCAFTPEDPKNLGESLLRAEYELSLGRGGGAGDFLLIDIIMLCRVLKKVLNLFFG